MDERERKPYVRRLWGVSSVVVLVFLILGYNLWRLQIVEGRDFSALAKGNVMKLVDVPSTRGQIVDKNGVILATSVPQFVLNLDWLDLQQAKSNWKDVIAKLATYIKPYWPNAKETADSITVDILANIQNHQWDQYRPVQVLDNVDPKLQAIIAEHQDELPGVSVDAIPVRYYPEKMLAGQILGYVREISDPEIAQLNANPAAQKAGFVYKQGDMVGKDGVEKSYDFWLRGQEGVDQVEVDNNARPVSKQVLQPPIAGKTVQLTIDAKLQKTVEDSLDQVINQVQKASNGNAKAGGAAVVIDVNTGQILAMVSRPGMDPNELTGTISQATSDKYFTNKIAPAASLNRALSGTYAPGSTFKMITAMAALSLKVATPTEQVRDLITSLGSQYYISQGFPEWGFNDFGNVNVFQALAHSSDIYFEVMGQRVFSKNPQIIAQIANEFGLGTLSGIDLPNEAKGTAPSATWKTANFGPQYVRERDDALAAIETKYAPLLAQAVDANAKQKVQAKKNVEINNVKVKYQQNVAQFVNWLPFDSYNNAIGQGYNAYTPLQLADYVATIANGGKHYSPYIVDKLLDPLTGKVDLQNQPKVLNSVSISPDILDTIKQGMRAVVSGTGRDTGTAKSLFTDVPDFTGGAKTGTAQIGNAKTIAGLQFNGAFVAFAPYDHPQIAFAAIVEGGEHGVDTAGSVAKAAFMEYFGWKSTNGG